MDTIVPAPEAALWEGFDSICADAEAKRDLAVQAARAERDWAMQSTQAWKAFRRVQAVAQARFEAKVKAATELCELTCQTAENPQTKHSTNRPKPDAHRLRPLARAWRRSHVPRTKFSDLG